MNDGGTTDTDYLRELVTRSGALATLREAPRSRAELEAKLDVSKATVHRLTTSLTDRGLVERTNGTYGLTGYGRAVAREVETFRGRVGAAERLAPLVERVEAAGVEFPLDAFRDARLTEACSHDPYRPLERHRELLDRTERYRGFDVATSIRASEFAAQLRDGLRAEVILPPEVAAVLVEDEAWTPEALDLDVLDVRIHDGLPFGLSLFDDRVGLCSHDAETGVVRAYADTDHKDAIAWGVGLFERYRAESEPLARRIEVGGEGETPSPG